MNGKSEYGTPAAGDRCNRGLSNPCTINRGRQLHVFYYHVGNKGVSLCWACFRNLWNVIRFYQSVKKKKRKKKALCRGQLYMSCDYGIIF